MKGLWKQIQKKLGVNTDGIPGIITGAVIADKLGLPSGDWKSIQSAVGTSSDGIPGLNTARAIMLKWKIWPKEEDVEAFYGRPGSSLVSIDLPYPMFLAWDKKTSIIRLTCHSLIANPLQRILQKTLAHYGREEVKELRLDLFGGCYNNRNKVGGSTKSMHAYGIAIDLDPDHNQLKWNKSKASFAHSDYDVFWNIVESENAVSLGRRKDYDWMHFQFADI